MQSIVGKGSGADMSHDASKYPLALDVASGANRFDDKKWCFLKYLSWGTGGLNERRLMTDAIRKERYSLSSIVSLCFRVMAAVDCRSGWLCMLRLPAPRSQGAESQMASVHRSRIGATVGEVI